MGEEPNTAHLTRTFSDVISAIRDGDLSQTRIARLSDLSRDDVKTLTEAWSSIPEETRVDLVLRCEQLSEERFDLNFFRALRIALVDPSPVVRQLAIAGLWEDESRDLLDRLRRIFQHDPSPDVRAAAAAALERYANQAVLDTLEPGVAAELRRDLLDVATDVDAPLAARRRALEALGPFAADPEMTSVLVTAYDSGEHGMQCSAVYAMGRSLDARWLPTILAELENVDPELQFEAVRAAGSLGSPDAFPGLLEAARSDDAEVRHAAIAAIGQIGGRGAARALERLSDDAGEADLDLVNSALDEVNTMLEPFQTTS